jgi:hypothetical protein
MELLNESDLDAPLGNVYGFDDELRTMSSLSISSVPAVSHNGDHETKVAEAVEITSDSVCAVDSAASTDASPSDV